MSTNAPKSVFTLGTFTDDPRFEGFGFAEHCPPSLLGRDGLADDLVAGFGQIKTNLRWEQPRLASMWVPPKVIGGVTPFNDFPGLNFIYPVFSERACKALRPVLEANGELLPLDSDTAQKYYFYNITTIVNALDHANSVAEFSSDPPTSTKWIDYFAFHEEKLRGLSIFRLREYSSEVMVTDEFVRQVEAAGLHGLSFTKIWPLPTGSNWRELASEQWRKRLARDGLKRHTMIIVLPLRGEEPDGEEQDAFNRFGDELDEQLAVQSLDETYFGSYEGDEAVESQFRMFITCPDVDALEQKLHDWLVGLQWQWACPFIVVKRYGDMYDPDAKAEVINIG